MSLPHFLVDDHTTMMNFIEKTLCCFESCFSRKAVFRWFVVITISIIRIYSYRFRIECTFRELKQQTGAFCYRFWSKHLPKLSYYQKKGEPAPMERVEGEKPRQKVLEAVRAIEMHMALSCIAMGILQSLSICYIGKVSSKQLRYQRTPSEGRVSEAALIHYFRKHFSAY